MSSGDRLANRFLEAHPEIAARMLETMPHEHAAEVFERVDARVAAGVLGRMLPASSALCAERLSVRRIAALLERLPHLAGAALLRHFSSETRDAVLAGISAPRVAALKLLLHYPASAVGAWMDPRVLTFADDSGADAAAATLEQTEHPYSRIYVLDRSRHVRGAINGVALLRGPRRGPISRLIEPVATLWARESITSAQDLELWETEIEAPVVNRQNEFVGVVSYSDLRRGSRRLDESRPQAIGKRGELTELVVYGVENVWQGLGELARSAATSPDRTEP